MAWEPPFEESCSIVNYTVSPIVNYTVYYRKVFSPTRKSIWLSVTVNRNVTSLSLKLSCKTEYDIAVTSVSGYGESALNESKIWNFKTGGGNVSQVIRPGNFSNSHRSKCLMITSSDLHGDLL